MGIPGRLKTMTVPLLLVRMHFKKMHGRQARTFQRRDRRLGALGGYALHAEVDASTFQKLSLRGTSVALHLLRCRLLYPTTDNRLCKRTAPKEASLRSP